MDAERNEANTKPAKKHFWRHYDPIEKFTFVTMIFAIVYSVITFGLYCIARDTLRISQKAFAYAKEIMIIGDGGKPGIQRPDKQAFLAINFANSGESVARNAAMGLGYFTDPRGIPASRLPPFAQKGRNVRSQCLSQTYVK